MSSSSRICLGSAVLFALLAGAPAHAQQAEQKRVLWVDAPPRGFLDFAYSLSMRSSEQIEGNSTISSNGYAPDHMRLVAGWYPTHLLGLVGRMDYARFLLQGVDFTGKPVNATAHDARADAGLALRLFTRTGLLFEPQVGYSYGKLPAFGFSDSNLALHHLTHHGPTVGLSLGYAPVNGAVAARARGLYMPLAIGGVNEAGIDQIQQFEAGADVALGRVPALGLRWAVVLGYDLRSSSGKGEGGRTVSQTTHHAQLGFRGTLLNSNKRMIELPPPTGPGELRGRILFADTQKPAAGVFVALAGREPVPTDAQGAFAFEKVGPGPVSLKVETKGYFALEQTVQVPAEDVANAELALAKKPPEPGRIQGRVLLGDGRDANKKQPLGNIRVLMGGVEAAISANDGTFAIEKAGPGPVQLAINATGYKPAEEIVAVPPEATAEIDLVVYRVGTILLATIKGQVRSVEGEPLRAKLRIPEAKIRTQSTPDGAFAVRLRGGRYTVTIQAKGYIEQTKTIDVADGDQAIFNVELSPKRKAEASSKKASEASSDSDSDAQPAAKKKKKTGSKKKKRK